jgi:biopolymer transport protein ExbD
MSMDIDGKGQKAQINVTPMIDVLLVLIIIFMVITPIAPRGLQAVVPPQADTPPPPGVIPREIVISIAKNGTIEINQQPVQPGTLPGRLAEIYGRHINDHVFVRGDRDLDYQAVAEVIDIARGAGWDRVGLMTH